MERRVVITGATGLIGKKLVALFHKRNIDVTVFARNAEYAKSVLPYAKNHVEWNIGKPELWAKHLENTTCMINLAGASVADGRWTNERKKEILDSRVMSTNALSEAILQCNKAPESFLSTSATGIYGFCKDEIITEESLVGSGFLAEVCEQWEASSQKASAATRVVNPRIGVVLSTKGGALAKMLPPFKFFVGGPLGSGNQWMPWIHLNDVVAMLHWAMELNTLKGAVNCVAPNPVTMRKFASELGNVMHKPSLFTVPEFMLKALLGEQASIVTEGQRVQPTKALSYGFNFAFPTLHTALEHLLENT